MNKICIFAGTTEGRELVEFLCGQPVTVHACVATEYGQTLLEPAPGLTISAQRLTRQEMEQLFRREGFALVVDATHPYASVVTENICAACETCAVPYLRLLRGSNALPDDCVFVEDIPAAVDFLSGVDGNILLTTGSKELHRFASVEGFAQRVYARVLPMEDSLRLCDEAGVKKAHVIAMQGPFGVEMNVATLRAVEARYLVTKDTGTAGGFDEKIAAARQAGATLVVIGRPPQKQGLDLNQTIQTLCSRFGLRYRPKVSIVGIGPGSRQTMTGQVRSAIAGADCIIGAKRMVEAVAEGRHAVFHAIAPEEIARVIDQNRCYRRFVVAMSGDVGFFSGAKKLLPLLQDREVELLPGLSSLVCLCARLGTTYEDVVSVSAHGRQESILPQVRRHRRLFTLVGGENGMGRLCQQLDEAGLGQVQVSVGERLSYPDEKITRGSARQLAQLKFDSLSAALIENPDSQPLAPVGLPDEAFLRAEAVPMTKSEVRAVCLSKLALPQDAVAWDIGAGTGSVSVEMALLSGAGRVYAIERKPEAVALLQENGRRFGLTNLEVVEGLAPQACGALPAATHAFIGGSSGNIRQIMDLLVEKNPAVRIVATAIALETVAELTACMSRFEKAEVVCLTVARGRRAGEYHLMTGQNPIYIFTMEGAKC